MSVHINNLSPSAVWTAFSKISAIPRCSKHEEKIKAFFRAFAQDKKFAVAEDAAGNMVIRKDGLRKDAEPISMQAHLDMVCVKTAASSIDFSSDPIQLVLDGEWVSTKGTTLGADNGIGLAMIYAILDDDTLQHGPLEAVLTVDEESALVGAGKFDGSLLRARRLINLDSEEEGIFYVGCAGGQSTYGDMSVKKESPPEHYQAYHASVLGLRGGHSGMDIDKGRANAILCLNHILALWEEDIRLSLFAGGSTIHNSIPVSASMNVLVPLEHASAFEDFFKIQSNNLKVIFAGEDMEFTLEKTGAQAALSTRDTRKIIQCMLCFPSGVISLSRDIEDLVETSSILAGAFLAGDSFSVVSSQRSIRHELLEYVTAKAVAALEMAGCTASVQQFYASWTPNFSSPMLAQLKEIYYTVTTKYPEVRVVHAGLECGALCTRVPGLDAISFGPDIENPHSPFERVNVASVARTWNFLLHCLQEL